MPIDLVIDERESSKPPEGLGSTNGDGGARSNADSTSHTDGASTPDVVSTTFHTIFQKLSHYISFHFIHTSKIQNPLLNQLLLKTAPLVV